MSTARVYPVIAHLTFAAGFSEQDPPDVKLTKLQTLLRAGNVSEQDLHLLAELMSVPTVTDVPLHNITPQRRKERTIAALVKQLRELSHSLPVLMLSRTCTGRTHHGSTCSTAHDEIRDMSVLLLITFRPDFAPSWMAWTTAR